MSSEGESYFYYLLEKQLETGKITKEKFNELVDDFNNL